MLRMRDLWDSTSGEAWEAGLREYWQYIKDGNVGLEKDMCTLHERVKSFSDVEDWYSFLLDEFFRWKHTAPNRYASVTKVFRRGYETDRETLNSIVRSLFVFDPEDIHRGVLLATQIEGLGPSGASSLLSLLFPEHFGGVDQFVVKALRAVSGLPEAARLLQMNPLGLTVPDAVILISIMRRKAAELNSAFASDSWTPRKLDMLLWAKGHEE